MHLTFGIFLYDIPNTLGGYHFLPEGGSSVCGGGGQILLGWSKVGTSFFFQWAKGGQNSLRVEEGGPKFSFKRQRGDQIFFTYAKEGTRKNGNGPSQIDAPLLIKKMIAPLYAGCVFFGVFM